MILFMHSEVAVDFGMEYLSESLALVDSQIERVESDGRRSWDPDAFGYFDRCEYLIGFGFVACQTYLTGVRGQFRLRRREANMLGPEHSSGVTIASLIDAIANYWKHSSEWTLEENTHHRKRTLKVLHDVMGTEDATEYLASNVLAVLAQEPTRFASLLPMLVTWRNALCQTQVENAGQ